MLETPLPQFSHIFRSGWGFLLHFAASGLFQIEAHPMRKQAQNIGTVHNVDDEKKNNPIRFHINRIVNDWLGSNNLFLFLFVSVCLSFILISLVLTVVVLSFSVSFNIVSIDCCATSQFLFNERRKKNGSRLKRGKCFHKTPHNVSHNEDPREITIERTNGRAKRINQQQK